MDNEQNMIPQNEPREKSFGPLISIVIIIVVLIVGALYFFWSRSSTEDVGMPALSESDDLNSIESDLGATQDVDAELSDLEADLDAELQSI